MNGCPDDPYRAAMRRLVLARDECEREAESLRLHHNERRQAATAAVDRSAAAVASARSRVRAARALVDQVNADTAALWRATLDVVPRSLASPGEPLPLPLPASPAGTRDERPVGEGEGPGMRVATILGEAQEALGALRQRRSPSLRGHLALAGVGAIAAAATYAVAALIAEAGHAAGIGFAQPAVWVGRLLALVSPLAGLPIVLHELRRRGLHGGVLAPAVVVVAGAFVVYGGAALLRG